MASLGPVSSGVRTEVTSGSLSGYHNRAYTDGYSVQASQFGPEGEDPVYQASGEKIVVSSYGRDNEGLYRLTTTAIQNGAEPAQFTGRTEGSFGISKQYINDVEGDIVSIEDFRSKPGNNQKVTLYHQGSFAGIATSQNTGGIISDMQKLAGAGDTLSIGAGLYKEKIVLDKDLSILGAGKGLTIIDGSLVDSTNWDKGSTFTINPGVNARISDMTIQGGYGSYYQVFGDNYIYHCGGGIFNQGRTVIDDCIITGNTAQFGGAIFNGGILDVIDSDISLNSASEKGGGIYQFDHSAAITLDHSNVHDNRAQWAGGGVCANGNVILIDSGVFNNRLYNGSPSDFGTP